VKKKAETGKRKAESGGAHVTPERIERSIQSRFQPLTGLTPQRLVAQLDAFNAGYLSEAARTWDAMLRRDDRLPALAQKRTSAIARYGFDVVAVDCDGDEAMEAEAKAHAEVIEFFLNHLTATNALDENERGGFQLLVRQMASAIGMRYAVHEVVWQPTADGLTATFRNVPLWFFENRTGKLRFLEQDYGIEGVDMPEDEWLVTVGAGLMEASSVAWMYKRLPLRDWLAYCEKFGFPGVLGETDAPLNSPEWQAMEAAVRAFANDFSAVVSKGSGLQLVEAKGSGTTLPFEPLIERMDKALAIMWRGGDLGTASGTGADNTGASLQGDETDLLEQDDAAWLGEILQTSVIRQVIEYHFGAGTRPLAYVQIRTRDRKDTRLDLDMFRELSALGVPLAVDDVLERFGLSRPRPDQELLTAKAEKLKTETLKTEPEPKAETGLSQNPLANEVASELGVPAGWLAPIEKLLAEMEAKLAQGGLTEDEARAFLAETQRRLPELLGDMDDGALAQIFEGVLGSAVVAGVRDSLQSQKNES
jgi:phage gp29-like protein